MPAGLGLTISVSQCIQLDEASTYSTSRYLKHGFLATSSLFSSNKVEVVHRANKRQGGKLQADKSTPGG
jgi:hypothetical protein